MRRYLLLLTLGFGLAAPAWAQEEGLLYGTVTTLNGQSYTGVLRWGKEESTWDDLFNADKKDNPYYGQLSAKERDEMEESRGSSWSRGWSWNGWGSSISRWSWGTSTHQFVVRFGDISRLNLLSSRTTEVVFKDGNRLEVGDGSNDIGATIHVADPEIGQIALEWERIRSVEFKAPAAKPARTLGSPLFARVKTRFGEYAGYIQWDNEESLSGDKLDGSTDDGKVSIEMGSIASIEPYRSGSLVKLKSGRELYITGSNDVNEENRGIGIHNPAFGRVLVSWDDFRGLTFEQPSGPGIGYAAFAQPRKIRGTVKTTDGQTLSGELAYDLDEAWDYEMLDGKDGKSEYSIPFRYIREIMPDGFSGSRIKLRSGVELRLSDSQDVNERNTGIMVFEPGSNNRPRFVLWSKVERITFE